ncbi:MAG: TIGR01548 family HAD-type hydrolase [Cyanobacteria bacterium P01_G01_bin.54]
MMIFVFDIDGVIRDVSGSYRRALADTVEQFTEGRYRPTPEAIDRLKAEGCWNNDWKGSQELIYRYWEGQGRSRSELNLAYDTLVEFFQSRYRGNNLNGYIASEPLLASPSYFAELTQQGVHWGFFSGATRASAEFVLQQRLGLEPPALVAMEDGPEKPDPTGFFQVCTQLQTPAPPAGLFYAGDTVADMYTIREARTQRPDLPLFAVGVIPPHAQSTAERKTSYQQQLIAAGADRVIDNIEQLTPSLGRSLAEG